MAKDNERALATSRRRGRGRTIDSNGSKRSDRGLSMIQPRTVMKGMTKRLQVTRSVGLAERTKGGCDARNLDARADGDAHLCES